MIHDLDFDVLDLETQFLPEGHLMTRENVLYWHRNETNQYVWFGIKLPDGTIFQFRSSREGVEGHKFVPDSDRKRAEELTNRFLEKHT